jgi:hypothetical protein
MSKKERKKGSARVKTLEVLLCTGQDVVVVFRGKLYFPTKRFA